MRRLRSPTLLVTLLASVSCAAPVRMVVRPDAPGACRAVGGDAPAQVTWIAPASATERARLDARCALVGPPLLLSPDPPPGAGPRRVTRLLVATWNLHDGEGDIAALLRDLLDDGAGLGRPDAVVLLLQEAVRTRAAASSPVSPRAAKARDFREAMAPMALHVAYAPNRPTAARPPGAAQADRGTAIVASLPLSRVQAIELPVERQRRVTLAAVLDGVTHRGRRWQLRVASVHLENRPGVRRLWVRAGAARSRQAAALLEGLDVGPWPGVQPAGDRADALVVGGDFNTWLSGREDALARMRAAFPAWPAEDRRATMRGWLRLDHLFARLPRGARAEHRRLQQRYDSDHYPVVVALDFSGT